MIQVLFFFSIFYTTQTKLRIWGPIGLAEIAVLLISFYFIFKLRLYLQRPSYLKKISYSQIFLFIFFGILLFNLITVGFLYEFSGWDLERHMFQGPIHDLVGTVYLIIILVSSCLVILDDKSTAVRSINRAAIFCAFSLGLLWMAWVLLPTSELTSFLSGSASHRFSALSRNPNQTALLCVCLLTWLIFVHCSPVDPESRLGKVTASEVAILVLLAVVGSATKSMSFGIALTLVTIFSVVYSLKSTNSIDRFRFGIYAVVCLSFIVGPIALDASEATWDRHVNASSYDHEIEIASETIGIGVNPRLDFDEEELAEPDPLNMIEKSQYINDLAYQYLPREVASELSQVLTKAVWKLNSRVLLLIPSLKIWSRRPILGWGPGAVSGDLEEFANRETHNTYIDILVASGVVGAGFFIYQIIYGMLILRSGQLALLIFSPLLSFAVFHHVWRHPIFWLVIVLIPFIAKESHREAKKDRDRSSGL